MSKEQQEKPKVVASEKTEPCGCHVVKFSDKTEGLTPCIFHGMIRVAECLSDAAKAMAAVAHRHRLELQKAAMMDAANKVIRP